MLQLEAEEADATGSNDGVVLLAWVEVGVVGGGGAVVEEEELVEMTEGSTKGTVLGMLKDVNPAGRVSSKLKGY